jgi:hypothetical protein
MASKRAPGTAGRRDGGVQTWTTTVAQELVRIGHSVDVLDPPNSAGYDLGLFANPSHTGPLRALCATSLLVCHGIVPDESPADGFDTVAFTSEEVRDHWRGDGPIIRQPVDLDFWSPAPGPKRSLVRYANRGGLDWLPARARDAGLQFVHLRNATPVQARDMLRGAACVLASGRAAVEAMACGAPVVICDERPYQGPLLDEDAIGAMRRNYSGRGGQFPGIWSLADVVNEAKRRGSMRAHAEQHHDVRKIVPHLLEAACCTC